MKRDVWGRPERLDAENETEAQHHVIAREAFVERYLDMPAVQDLVITLAQSFRGRFDAPEKLTDRAERDAWRRELLGAAVDFVMSREPRFEWLINELAIVSETAVLQALVGLDYSLEHDVATQAPKIEVYYSSRPGESLESARARWDAERRRVESLLQARRGKKDDRSEDSIRRAVGWFFERAVEEKSIRAIAQGAGAERSDVRRGIRRAERLLSLATPPK